MTVEVHTRYPRSIAAWIYAYWVLLGHLSGAEAARITSDAGIGSEARDLSHTPKLGANSRILRQEDTAVEDLFSAVLPCPGLENILTISPDPKKRLGNFTQIPSSQVLRECAASSSVYLLDGSTLPDVIAQPTPAVKIVTLEQSDATIWPPFTTEYHFPPHTVNIIDCQNQIFDIRNRDHTLPIEDVTAIFIRCRAIFPDAINTWVKVMYFYDSECIFPCNGTAPLSQAADYPRTQPAVFPELSANFGPSTVHVINVTLWCHTEQDIIDVFLESDARAPSLEQAEKDSEKDSEGIPTWVVIVGASALACVVTSCCALAAVWLCYGHVCCCGKSKKGAADDSRDESKPRPRSSQERVHAAQRSEISTEELAMALSLALQSNRNPSAHQSHNDNQMSVTTPSDTAQNPERGYELRECLDCGQPHVEQISHRASYRRLQRSEGQSSSDQGSGSAELSPLMKREGSSVDTSSRPPEQRMHRMHMYAEHEISKQAQPRSGPVGGGHLYSTEAWLEDSLEARAAMTAEAPLYPAQESSQEVEVVRPETQYSGTTGSISLAPARSSVARKSVASRHADDAFSCSTKPAPRSGPNSDLSQGGNDVDATVSCPSSPHQQPASPSHTAVSYPSSSRPHSASPTRSFQALTDADGSVRSPWIPPKGSLVSPGMNRGSTCAAGGAFGDSPMARLKPYSYLPPTHPLRHSQIAQEVQSHINDRSGSASPLRGAML